MYVSACTCVCACVCLGGCRFQPKLKRTGGGERARERESRRPRHMKGTCPGLRVPLRACVQTRHVMPFSPRPPWACLHPPCLALASPPGAVPPLPLAAMMTPPNVSPPLTCEAIHGWGPSTRATPHACAFMLHVRDCWWVWVASKGLLVLMIRRQELLRARAGTATAPAAGGRLLVGATMQRSLRGVSFNESSR